MGLPVELHTFVHICKQEVYICLYVHVLLCLQGLHLGSNMVLYYRKLKVIVAEVVKCAHIFDELLFTWSTLKKLGMRQNYYEFLPTVKSAWNHRKRQLIEKKIVLICSVLHKLNSASTVLPHNIVTLTIPELFSAHQLPFSVTAGDCRHQCKTENMAKEEQIN